MAEISEGFARRAVLLAAATTTLGPLTLDAAQAASPDPSSITFAPLFTTLPTIPIPDGVDFIQTTGHTHPGVGAARYVATQAAGAAPYRTRSANGRWFELAEDLVFVEMFGALGGDPLRDDGPAIQAAINYVEMRGGGVVWCAPGRQYYLGETIVIDPTRISIEAGSAVWNFSLKRFYGRSDHEEENDGSVVQVGHPAATTENACILVRVPPDSTQYGHDSHYCRALRVKGPPSNTKVADGFYFDTPSPAFSSRWTFYNVEATESLGRGLVLRNRSYLAKAYASSFGGFYAGVEFLGGEDAGENFSLFGGSLGSSGGPALKNHGGEFYLFGVSVDFPKSFIHQTAGTIHCFGCHFETGSQASFVGRPFDIVGELYIDGGQIMGGAPLDGSPIPFDNFFYSSTAHSRIVLLNVWGYNWQCAAHVMCGGPGRFVIERLLGGTNWNIPGIVKRDPAHSLAGEAGLFERANSRLDLWVEGQGALKRIARDRVAWSNGAGDYATLSAERSTARAHSGSTSLAITKAGVGRGTGASCHILIPFPSGGQRLASCEFWVKAVGDPDHGAPSTILFTQLFWASRIGRDAHGVPELGQTQYMGEAKLDLLGYTPESLWSRLAFGDRLFADSSDPDGGYAPVWATHLLLQINLISFPPVTVFLDDLYAFAI